MIIILKRNPAAADVARLQAWIEEAGLKASEVRAGDRCVLALEGDASGIDLDALRAYGAVENVWRDEDADCLASRARHATDTVVDVGGVRIGGGHFALIAGPCSVESREQILSVARAVKSSGAHLLRGGAYKPRTSPYAFQGLGRDGLALLLEAREASGLPVVSEITDPSQIDEFRDVDLIQVGARNMQNYELLKALGKCRRPVLLKRGMASTYRELLSSAEYILAGGNDRVILCERGIRTFENETRNTLDLSAIPALRAMTHLPIVVDPTHATGSASMVLPMALAATAAGADGLMIEVHADPTHARSDGAQALTPDEFDTLARRVRAILPYAFGREEK